MPERSTAARLREWRKRGQLLTSHWVERTRYWLFLPRKRHQFFIVTAAYNAAAHIDRTLRSVEQQAYPPHLITHLVIDDASSDGTADKVERWLADTRPKHEVALERNSANLGGCANYTRGFRAAPSSAIVLQLDGDDWLPDRDVLGYLNMLYHDADLWMTYNSWRTPSGKAALHHRALASDVVTTNDMRSVAWRTSHLHSFRARLFAHVRDDSLIDPETGTWWRYAVDQSHYLPMLELAGKHARHVHRITYVYNLNEASVLTQKREEQLGCERRIRSLPRYLPLGALDDRIA